MIQLKVDYSLLSSYFGISVQKIQQYPNMDLEEIMKAEAEQGNEKARDYEKILSNPDKLKEIFQLASPENKFIILQNMSEADVDDLLIYLSPEQLSVGLDFFTDAKLLTLCEKLPIEELSEMVLKEFDVKDILSLMGEDTMDKFLQEPDVKRNYAQKYFEQLDQNALEKIITKSFGGKQEGKTKDEYLEALNGLENYQFQQFLYSLERNEKIGLIDGVIEQENKLLYLFENGDIVRPMDTLMKEDKIKMMKGLKQKSLIPMIKELPENLTQLVLTQIDTQEFAKVIAKDFKNILKDVVLFASSAA